MFLADDVEAESTPLPPGVTARYLQKPFDVEALLAAVRDLVGQQT